MDGLSLCTVDLFIVWKWLEGFPMKWSIYMQLIERTCPSGFDLTVIDELSRVSLSSVCDQNQQRL